MSIATDTQYMQSVLTHSSISSLPFSTYTAQYRDVRKKELIKVTSKEMLLNSALYKSIIMPTPLGKGAISIAFVRPSVRPSRT